MDPAQEMYQDSSLLSNLKFSTVNQPLSGYILITENINIDHVLRILGDVTFIADIPVELNWEYIRGQGFSGALFNFSGGGTLTLGRPGMSGSITINGTYDADGALIGLHDGTLVMHDRVTLRGNNSTIEAVDGPGGVFVSPSGTFIMYGGTISGNSAFYGGGVVIYQYGRMFMHGGTISGNIAHNNGGGVFVVHNNDYFPRAVRGRLLCTAGVFTTTTPPPAVGCLFKMGQRLIVVAG